MIRNYITVAIRNLLREKVYAVINVVGLGIGIACTLLLALYVHHDWSFDRHHEKKARVFRVLHETRGGRDVARYALTHDEVGMRLEDTFPEIVRSSRVIRSGALTGFSQDRMQHKTFLLVDPDFTEMFSYRLMAGEMALRDPKDAVVTLSAAENLLGEPLSDPASLLGRTIHLTKRGVIEDHVIVGVIESPPKTSTLKFHLLIRYENRAGYGKMAYNDWSTEVYVETQEGKGLALLQEKIREASLNLLPEQIADMRSKERIGGGKDDFSYVLQPLLDVRFDQQSRGGYAKRADRTLMETLGWIGAVVMVLSCVNFMTLSLSRSASRAVEVGVRKVMGARRANLVRQFWGESIVTAALGFFLAVGLAELLLPWFNLLSSRSLDFSALGLGPVIGVGVMLTLIVGAVGGGYPGVVLSRLQPTQVLAGRYSNKHGSRVTGLLIALQYAVSTSLLISTVVIVKQMDFVRNADLGYTQDPLVSIDFHRSAGDVDARGERFLRAAEALPGVVSVGRHTGNRSTFGLKVNDRDENVMMFTTAVGPNYLQTMGVTLSDGRYFRPNGSPEAGTAIVNERFLEQTGYKLGDHILNYLNNVREPLVVGVFRDYHFDSLHRGILPQVMILDPKRKLAMGLVRVRGDRLRETMDELKAIWGRTGEDLPYKPQFLDAQVAAAYRKDERSGKIVGGAAACAILIACMGLFGQASLAVSRRTKEIGVRKSVGATVADILRLLSRDLIALMIVSNCLAWPAAYYLSRDWLKRFVYRIELTPDLFAIGGLGALIIAALTVGWLAIRAARGNPVEALRYE